MGKTANLNWLAGFPPSTVSSYLICQDPHEVPGVLKGSGVQDDEGCVVSMLDIYIYIYVPGSKLPLFPYNRGWSSTQ